MRTGPPFCAINVRRVQMMIAAHSNALGFRLSTARNQANVARTPTIQARAADLVRGRSVMVQLLQVANTQQ